MVRSLADRTFQLRYAPGELRVAPAKAPATINLKTPPGFYRRGRTGGGGGQLLTSLFGGEEESAQVREATRRRAETALGVRG